MGRYNHSRSRSRSRSRNRRNSSPERRRGGGERRREDTMTGGDQYRLYVAVLSVDVRQSELEREFGQYGPLVEVWLAKVSPLFAFIVYKHREDAEAALDDMNGRYLKLNKLNY
jgi:RNA recognition motif-containing protein